MKRKMGNQRHGMYLLVVLLLAASPTNAALKDLLFNEVQVSNLDMVVDLSFNFGGWVEFYNPSSSVVSLEGCHISDEAANLTRFCIPDGIVVPAHGYAVFFFDHHGTDERQADFKLNADGGHLFLSDRSGNLVTDVEYPEAVTRCSWARTIDGGDVWSYTADVTPGKSNASASFSMERLDCPDINRQSCVFDHIFSFQVTIPEGCTLRYTTDGSVPTRTNGSTSSSGSFRCMASTYLYRFRLYRDGYLPSPVVTRSFIYSRNKYTVPVVSIVTDDAFIYGDSLGIMVKGVNGITGLGSTTPSNWNRDWDRVANLQYILPDGTVAVDQEGVICISGGWSRVNSPHTFKYKADKTCEGMGSIDYQLFTSKPYMNNKAVLFRNGDDQSGRLVDAALQTIIQTSGIDVDGQAYEPVVHYINGKYMGFIDMRETNNKQFVRANYNYDSDEIDMFEYGHGEHYKNTILPVCYNQLCGTRDAMYELRKYTKLAADEDAYDEVCRRLDIDEYINYMATFIYLGTADWVEHTNNCKGWRPRTPDGRFRMVQYDVEIPFRSDETFDQFVGYRYITNSITGQQEEYDLVNIFVDLCANSRFRRQFIDTFCLVCGSVFHEDHVAAVVDSLVADMKGMMALEGLSPDASAKMIKNHCNTSRMETMVAKMQNFPRLKMSGMQSQYLYFSASDESARLAFNGIPVPTNKFGGKAYGPVTLRVDVPLGKRFIGWRGRKLSGSGDMPYSMSILSTDLEYTLPLGCNCVLTAMVEDEDDGSSPVCINEVSADNGMATNDYFKRGDWIELYNTSSRDIDIAGCTLTAYSNLTMGKPVCSYTLPSMVDASGKSITLLHPREHRLLWCDERAPLTQLHIPFKLDVDSGMVIITAPDAMWADTLCYIPHGDHQSVGRYPDGGNSYCTFNYPTAGKPNRMSSCNIGLDERSVREVYVASITGISPTMAEQSFFDGAVYDLAGHRVADDASAESLRGLQPGIYIVHGRKFLHTDSPFCPVGVR